jgi:hypothetical protein
MPIENIWPASENRDATTRVRVIWDKQYDDIPATVAVAAGHTDEVDKITQVEFTDGKSIDHLIKVLKRARRQAFGATDEDKFQPLSKPPSMLELQLRVEALESAVRQLGPRGQLRAALRT